ncbi:diguanylate cyclase (GGDEF)-like protein [Paraburkholderia silvatlantica]|uniref:diguanylate cyclase n=2 Tax=Paraburkholderia silvatlantica TaxID=321895 RepID=A0A2V4TJ89_9BURK|nr:diguanylate cyclase (GGDEF)-like protein [Paraburkholderia silvatlantica]TDQ81664.1 diguanylate cyclase (GGDEF)-like protein [Paraburkholderia silvatlantica]
MYRRRSLTPAMHVDLLTIYLLLIGTLLASSLITLWEHRTHPARSKALRILAGGYATLATGCAAVLVRADLPGVWGYALSNLGMMAGYLLVLHGVATLNGRQYRAASIALLALIALTWATWGARHPQAMWYYASAFPIALVSAMTSRELLRGDGMKGMQSRHVATFVTGFHALFYVFRTFVLPLLGSRYGDGFVALVSKITMYEGVLYSIILPMALLKLVREETHGQLLRESQTDYLTRLGNRRWFFEEGERVMREIGTRQPVSLLAFDLDHFKTINDRYGHKTGDEVLETFADIARSAMGPEAILARIGGEEFAALLPGHDRVHAKAVGEAIARRFAQTAMIKVDGVAICATVSVGLAQHGHEASTLSDLLAAADAALYSAKALGGNRLEMLVL